MFKIIDEPLPDLKLIRPNTFEDVRGLFVKTYHEDSWKALGLPFTLREEFFSVSKKDVLRGMHFQLPPYAHNKLVYCISGSVLDVIVDLRKDMPTFGQYAAVDLSAENHEILYIPVGFAHGFLSLTENSCMIYKTDKVYAPEHDSGVHWESFGFNWPVKNPIVSERDSSFSALDAVVLPF